MTIETFTEKEARLLAALKVELSAQSQAAASLFIAGDNVRAYECSVENCGRPAYAAGHCNAHYIRSRKGFDLTAPVRARKREDKCAECGGLTGSKGGWGLCQRHYRKRRYSLIKDALIKQMGGKCERCLGVFPRPVYDFHHTGGKTESPATLIANGSPEAIAKELTNCILLCANCHRLEHNELY